ncbi:AfsA-related hotdog domain-containing protein [Nocardia sp. NPDC058705]|uniref:AfsA-related hotdog domain-containing protein n=1 Tax=Nocardia sp. NPDC058705 TaxID=3346609 RepID=UPI0036C72D8D
MTGGLSAVRGTLGFEQLVPAALAHRRGLAEVYVADTAIVGSSEFLVAVQVPRAHSLWFDRLVAYHDPFSAVEAVRQALLVVGQRHLGVPADAPASLQRMSFAVEDLSAFRDSERDPFEGIVRLRPGAAGTGRGYYHDVSFDATLTVRGVLAMTVRGSGITFPREAYDEFRELQQGKRATLAPVSARPVRRLPPELVGRRDPRNVVLARNTAQELVVVVDRAHPSFFDHQYDHVPGPLLLEVFRQAAVVAATAAGLLETPVAAVIDVEAQFTDFAELDAEITCTTAAVGDIDLDEITVEVALHQYGNRIALAHVELAHYPVTREGNENT